MGGGRHGLEQFMSHSEGRSKGGPHMQWEGGVLRPKQTVFIETLGGLMSHKKGWTKRTKCMMQQA